MNLFLMATKPAVTVLTAEELLQMLAHVIAGVAGKDEAFWRKIIGPLQRHVTWKFVSHNWTVEPKGTASQRNVVERAVDIVRAEHPYID